MSLYAFTPSTITFLHGMLSNFQVVGTSILIFNMYPGKVMSMKRCVFVRQGARPLAWILRLVGLRWIWLLTWDLAIPCFKWPTFVLVGGLSPHQYVDLGCSCNLDPKQCGTMFALQQIGVSCGVPTINNLETSCPIDFKHKTTGLNLYPQNQKWC